MNPFTESTVEEAALDWLSSLGYEIKHGPDIAPEMLGAERSSYDQVILEQRLKRALKLINPDLPQDALDEAFRKILRLEGSDLTVRNRTFHHLLVNGVGVEYRRADGSIGGAQVKLIADQEPDLNDFLAVNQFTVTENKNHRRPDIVIFLNGLPIAVLELKNAADESATIWKAFDQLQTYKHELPTFFSFNELLVISDGSEARIGTLTAGKEWFKNWRTVEGEDLATLQQNDLRVLLDGVFEKRRLIDILQNFIVFEDDGGGKLTKKMAGYHQFHAVLYALHQTLRAIRLLPEEALAELNKEAGFSMNRRGGELGDRRVGVVWHTQGSGKSLTMAFYAGRVIREPAMANPTILVLTDRNDLDDQLFGTFSRCADLLRQPPAQAADRKDLREKLSVNAGGVVFSTIQKFMPEGKGDRHPILSERRNIVVIADEAHRSQYDFIDGFARHMRDALPNASFIGFTGTPIELTDKNTRSVFGDYISIYDIQRAVEDEATVPIYYESRLAKLELDEAEKPHIDPEFEEVTEGEELERKEKLKSKWAQLEAVVGAEKRVGNIAKDIVGHFEERSLAMNGGKAMIVCMSRRIAIELYQEIAKLRPDWADPEDAKGTMKVVMTGSASDPVAWQEHIRNKPRREELAKRFRNASDLFNIVIVRDMWLTGFDAPSLHTMYIDKPMRAHGLMQAIARVNRVFENKPGGLVVDYLGLAAELKAALANYTASGGAGETAIDQSEAIKAMQEKYEVCRGILHGLNWGAWTSGTASQKLDLLPAAQEHILSQENGKDRFIGVVQDLNAAFALSVPSDEALKIRDDLGFFKTIKAVLVKGEPGPVRSDQELDLALRQIVSKAVVSDEIIDIFAAAGLKKPDISILSDEFLAEVKGMTKKNVAVELLRKLLSGEITRRKKKNVVQARSFAELLAQVIKRYQNRAVEAAVIIEELIELAREMREAGERGEKLGLSDDELAFFDALGTNDSAVAVLGDDTLREIARELVEAVRKNIKIDWTMRESVRAEMRVMIKRILRKHGYPPDKQEKATQTVLEQAEALSEEWAT